MLFAVYKVDVPLNRVLLHWVRIFLPLDPCRSCGNNSTTSYKSQGLVTETKKRQPKILVLTEVNQVAFQKAVEKCAKQTAMLFYY